VDPTSGFAPPLYISNIRMMINQVKGKEEVREYKGKGGYSA